MAVAELTAPTCAKQGLGSSQLSYLSARTSSFRRLSFRPPRRTHSSRISCSVNQTAQAPVAVETEVPKSNKPECFGVFCLTYDLKAEEETKSWKKLINVAVSGAAGMISNHLLFKLASGQVFGHDQPIALKLLGSERSFQALEGTCLEWRATSWSQVSGKYYHFSSIMHGRKSSNTSFRYIFGISWGFLMNVGVSIVVTGCLGLSHNWLSWMSSVSVFAYDTYLDCTIIVCWQNGTMLHPLSIESLLFSI